MRVTKATIAIGILILIFLIFGCGTPKSITPTEGVTMEKCEDCAGDLTAQDSALLMYYLHNDRMKQ